MRKFATYFLVSIILTPSLYNVGVVAYWVANRQYIAAELCVKRKEVGNCCQGKCYLNKKLADAPSAPQNREEKAPDIHPGFELAECNPLPILPDFIPTAETPKNLFPSTLNRFPAGYKGSIFHPPPTLA